MLSPFILTAVLIQACDSAHLSGNVMSSITGENCFSGRISIHFLIEAKGKLHQRKKPDEHTSRLECEDTVLSEMLCEGLQGWENHHLDFTAPAIFFKKRHDLVSQFCLYIGFTWHELFSTKPLLL